VIRYIEREIWSSPQLAPPVCHQYPNPKTHPPAHSQPTLGLHCCIIMTQ